jgi:hypothetical protein
MSELHKMLELKCGKTYGFSCGTVTRLLADTFELLSAWWSGAASAELGMGKAEFPPRRANSRRGGKTGVGKRESVVTQPGEAAQSA